MKKELLYALLSVLPDESFSKLQFLWRQKRLPNLSEPKTLNEKLQWIKLNVREAIYTQCVDKFAVRSFVEEKIGAEYLIPSLGVFPSSRSIPFSEFPERFVLKATHGSGWNILCTNKAQFDQHAACQKIDIWLGTNFYTIGREWAYKDVPPRVVCEEFLDSGDGQPPPDFKFFCFHGKAKFVQVDFDRFVGHKRNVYDLEWNRLPFDYEYPGVETAYSCPENLKEMTKVAESLSREFPFVRVDLYSCNGRILFGELTFYPEKAAGRFSPYEWDEKLGQHLSLEAYTGR